MTSTNLPQIFVFVVALAILKRNFDEGAAIGGESAGILKSAMWGVACQFDDLCAAGVIFGLFRIISGGGAANLLWIVPWAATTFLILRSAGGHIQWNPFLSKLADDVSDGALIALCVIFWMDWGTIAIPSFSISF